MKEKRGRREPSASQTSRGNQGASVRAEHGVNPQAVGTLASPCLCQRDLISRDAAYIVPQVRASIGQSSTGCGFDVRKNYPDSRDKSPSLFPFPSPSPAPVPLPPRDLWQSCQSKAIGTDRCLPTTCPLRARPRFPQPLPAGKPGRLPNVPFHPIKIGWFQLPFQGQERPRSYVCSVNGPLQAPGLLPKRLLISRESRQTL